MEGEQGTTLLDIVTVLSISRKKSIDQKIAENTVSGKFTASHNINVPDGVHTAVSKTLRILYEENGFAYEDDGNLITISWKNPEENTKASMFNDYALGYNDM